MLRRAHLSSPIALLTTGEPDGFSGFLFLRDETMKDLFELLNRHNFRFG